MEATLDKFGRLVIPKPIRDDLDLAPGAVLDVGARNGAVVLKPLRDEPNIVDRGGVLVFTGEAAGDLIQGQEAQRRARNRKAAAWEPA